jgi:hypothetical protein
MNIEKFISSIKKEFNIKVKSKQSLEEEYKLIIIDNSNIYYSKSFREFIDNNYPDEFFENIRIVCDPNEFEKEYIDSKYNELWIALQPCTNVVFAEKIIKQIYQDGYNKGTEDAKEAVREWLLFRLSDLFNGLTKQEIDIRTLKGFISNTIKDTIIE